MPFIPQIIGLIWHKITEVLQIELQRKDQIKSAIVALCMYSYIKKSPDGSQTLTITEKHHRGEMRVILSEGDINKHITKSVDEIDKHIEETLQSGSDLRQYLDTVKLDGILIPTPIYPRIFDKIEEMNPDIAINVWRWNEELATPKPIIAKLHLEWYPELHENAPQRVAISVKGVNDFEEFKNYGRMINAPCVIIADFETDNKKSGLIYGGKTRLISEQCTNSFCYLVHWINTDDVWGPFIYREENATYEFI
ncbi:hypothetical protein GLOIN_2v1481003 [Rhizophagus clarus]|uniref:Uncharacterized protein n=1 Tax=Rhizophagus clarus TaxID=94130 RepID=A0A8H3KZG5_9GLOM|nr:hypothetical protein GLOIN_2v1481003 [Rhizophagus clarus]